MSRTEKSMEVESGLMIIMASEELNEEWLLIGVEWFIHVIARISTSLLLLHIIIQLDDYIMIYLSIY